MIYAYIHNTCVQESYLLRKKPDLLQILRSARFAREERKRQDWNNNIKDLYLVVVDQINTQIWYFS